MSDIKARPIVFCRGVTLATNGVVSMYNSGLPTVVSKTQMGPNANPHAFPCTARRQVFSPMLAFPAVSP